MFGILQFTCDIRTNIEDHRQGPREILPASDSTERDFM